MPGRPAIASNHPPARIGRSSPLCHSWSALEILDVAGWTALTLGIHAAILLAPLLGVGLYGQFGAAGLHDVRIYFDYASRALRAPSRIVPRSEERRVGKSVDLGGR